MASQAYYDWMADGRPWKFARPVAAVRDHLRAHGYTVYDQGNQSHLTHEPPEDHTPFSATGWPVKSPYPYCLAIDVMPPAPGQKSKITGKPLPSLQQLAARLRADKNGGHPGAAFVKYMNWEPEGNNTGPCYHETWTPDYARRSSSDRGHIHLSGRTDAVNSTASDGYDLVARVMGDDDVALTDTEYVEIQKRSKQGVADAFADVTLWGTQFRANFDRAVDQAMAAGPVTTALANLTALVMAKSPATPEQFAAAVAPMINAQLGDGASPAEVEAILRRVFGGLDDATS